MNATIATPDQRRRALEALSETCRLLQREEAYLPHNQKPERIAEYKAHIAKLELMIAR